MQSDQVKRTYLKVIDFIQAHGLETERLSQAIEKIKTQAYYQTSMETAVREFYRGDIDAGDFIDEMIRLIEGQLRRAWNEGMRKNELDPSKDMTDEWEGILQDAIDSELDHVLDFAQAIEDAKNPENPDDFDPTGFRDFYHRVALWANRYNEIVSLALITTKPEERYVWILGPTEHCWTCATLAGTVAKGSDWKASGIRPQNPPNKRLECGGWNCQCSLQKTKAPLTPGGIPPV